MEELLAYIRITNPDMTMERLLDELLVCGYAASCIIEISQNYSKSDDKF
jgi:hypothetical protein